MNRFYYDLHLHSCLSPCGDADNTPNNVAGMASLSGLNVVALTDHNSSKNCPAFFAAAERYGITAIAGMELTTSEDIHIVCLFPTLESALAFDEYVFASIIPVKNRADIFGEQQILDSEDNVIGQIDNLLTVATGISVENVKEEVARFGGICYPAHIDKMSNGIISILGTLPEALHFEAVELHSKDNIEDYLKLYNLSDKQVIFSSDAHYLGDIRDAENYFDLDADVHDHDSIRQQIFSLLGGKG